MDMKQLIIVVEARNSLLVFDAKDESSCIKAMFNPNRLTESRSTRWDDQQTPKRDNPEMQFTGAEPSTLGIDLFFDTYDSDKLKKDNVRLYTDRLRQLTTVENHGDRHRPPVCQLWWGEQSMFFQGVLTQLETQFTMFMGDGTPVRATNRCTFKQWRSNTSDLKKQDLQSADLAKLWVVKQGQTLADVAAHEYGDPREWRAIAQANDIDDPLALAYGQQLVLPPRRSTWQASREP